MKVWKKVTIRYFKDGKRSTKKVKGAKPKKEHSKRYYGTLKKADGRSKQIPLTEEKETSEKLLRRLQGEEDKRRALGITEDDLRGRDSVSPHLSSYLDYLTSKGNTPKYIMECELRLRKLFNEAKINTLEELSSDRVRSVLSKWREKNSLSIATCNHYVRAIKGFTNFLLRERKLNSDPFIGLQTMNANGDRRRKRRAFTEEELKRLLNDTQLNKRYMGKDWIFEGADRYVLYTLAIYTGLRAKELSSLSIDSFSFEEKTITVSASNTKNKEEAILPVPSHVLDTVRKWIPHRGGLKKHPSTRLLFPGDWIKQSMAGRMLDRDMVSSNIPKIDERGFTLDFHSLRYTFISNLARGNVHPSKAQRLARHSTISLTMDVYTSLNLDDLREAVDSLPQF